jgi:hypothetical protein
VILLGVLADQQFTRYRQRSLAHARLARGAPDGATETAVAATPVQ